MATPRQYATAADRQAAYRARRGAVGGSLTVTSLRLQFCKLKYTWGSYLLGNTGVLAD